MPLPQSEDIIMSKTYSTLTSLNPLQATHDAELQEFIDAHPFKPLGADATAGLSKLLALNGKSDLNDVMAAFGRFVKHLPCGITGCPVYTVEWTGGHLIFRDDLFYIDDLSDNIADPDHDIAGTTHTFQYAGYNARHAIIGYDTEFVSTEREIPEDERSGEITVSQQMVSYQWYFSLGIEHVAVVLVTDKRLTQNAFVRQFLANALPDRMITYNAALAENRVRKLPIKKVYAAAHFSLVDAGALLPSYDRIERIAPDGEEYSFEVPIIKTEEKQWKDRAWARERRPVNAEVWVNGRWLLEESLKRKKARRRSTKKKTEGSQTKALPKIWVHFCDTMNLLRGSLAKLGDAISIKKLDPDGQIHQMDVLWTDNPRAFLLYSARDVIVTGQAIVYYHRLFGPLVGGSKLYTRVPKYGEAHFKILFQQIYYRHATGEEIPISPRTGLPKRIKNREWKEHLGYREKEFSAGNEDLTPYGWIRRLIKEKLDVYPQTIPEFAEYLIAKRPDDMPPAKQALLLQGLEMEYQNELNRTERKLVPTPGVLAFLPFCYGGRAEARVVGAVGECCSVDLFSAYPTALLAPGMKDYSFLRAYTTTGSECEKRVEELIAEGPFQIAGVYVSFIFKPDVEPVFPMKVKSVKANGDKIETLIFPVSGASHVPWPEFYVAYNQGLLEKCIVHSVLEFERLETTYLADHMKELMRLRKGDSHNYLKLLINSSYGKTLSGLSDLRDNPYDIDRLSAISCVPIGAIMTSVCRAIIGEIINRNNWFATATDAVMIEGPGPIKYGPLGGEQISVVKEISYDYLETDFVADQGVFFKRAGYMLFGQQVKDDVPSGIDTIKFAPLGMKIGREPDPDEPGRLGVEAVKSLIGGLTQGELRTENWQAFSDIDREYSQQQEKVRTLRQDKKNNQNKQSRIRITAGISNEQLRHLYRDQHDKNLSFRGFEAQKIEAFLKSKSDGAPAALKRLIEELQELQAEYEEIVSRDIFPRRFLRTVRVNHSYDFKRMPILDSIQPEKFTFTYGPSDGSADQVFEIEHVRFDTRPVYSADEYRQLVLAAERNMTPQQYIEMLEDLEFHGVLSNYHDIDAFRSPPEPDDSDDAE